MISILPYHNKDHLINELCDILETSAKNVRIRIFNKNKHLCTVSFKILTVHIANACCNAITLVAQQDKVPLIERIKSFYLYNFKENLNLIIIDVRI